MIFLDKWYKWWDERKAHYKVCIFTRQDKQRKSSQLGFESTIILLVWWRQCYGHVTGSITYWASGGLAKELRKMMLLLWFLSVCPSVCHIVRPSVYANGNTPLIKSEFPLHFIFLFCGVKCNNKIQLWLQSEKSNRKFTRGCMQNFGNMLPFTG